MVNYMNVINFEDLQYLKSMLKLKNELSHSEKSGDLTLEDAFKELQKNKRWDCIIIPIAFLIIIFN